MRGVIEMTKGDVGVMTICPTKNLDHLNCVEVSLSLTNEIVLIRGATYFILQVPFIFIKMNI